MYNEVICGKNSAVHHKNCVSTVEYKKMKTGYVELNLKQLIAPRNKQDETGLTSW